MKGKHCMERPSIISTNGKRAQKNKHKISLTRYMMYVLLVTFTITGVSLSRYSTTSSGNDTTRAAKFEVTITPDGWSNNGATAHGTNVTYKDCVLKVENKSEVAVRARLVINSGNGYVSSISPAGSSGYSAWFNLSPGSSQNVTVNITGATTGNDVTMSVEYEQID